MEQQDKLDQLVAENLELLALTKQAFVKREVEKESVPVDEEWEKFAAEHADELEALDHKAAANCHFVLANRSRYLRHFSLFTLHFIRLQHALSAYFLRQEWHLQPSTSCAWLAIPNRRTSRQNKLYLPTLLRHYRQIPSKQTQ